jgi:hypothetical protein
VDYATNWSTLSLTGYATESWVTAGFYPLSGNPSGFLTASSLTPYLSKAGNLTGLTNLTTARNNLQLGALDTAVFGGVTLQGSGGNVAQFSPTALTLTQPGYGLFTIQPSQGIVFPDATIQTTAYPGPVGATQWGSIGGSLINQTDLYNSLAAKLDSATAATTYAPIAAGQPISGTVGQVLTKNSGTSWDSSWATLIPGDRYLTSSTTSNTVSNGNKTFTIGTGLSYTPTQNITISYDAANHMHGEVLTYNSGTGVLTVDVNHHTGSGTYTAWVVNVGGVTPATSVAWGAITGVIGNQSDLAGELAAKLDVTTAASTYFTIASAAGKANLSGATFTGKVNLATIGVATPSINLGGQCDSAPASAANGDIWISNAAAPKLTYRMGGVNYNLPVLNQFNTFTNQMVIDTASSTTAALRVTQRGAGNAITVEDSTTPDATAFVVDQFGKVGIGVAPSATAALKVDTNGIMFGDGTTQTTAATGGGGVAWGAITGTIASQTDLVTELSGKANLSGAIFTGLVEATTPPSTATVDNLVINRSFSEQFLGFNWADLISTKLNNISFSVSGSDPESPVVTEQSVTFDFCCPEGINNLKTLGGTWPNVILGVYLSGVQQVSWDLTSSPINPTANTRTLNASFAFGTSYEVFAEMNLGAGLPQQKSRFKIGEFSV